MQAKIKPGKKRLILLDSHAIIHRAYHALPEFVSSKGEPTGGLYGLSTMLIRIFKDLKPDYVVAAFDLPKPTYRHEAYKEYKAGRKKADDALISQLKRSRDVFAAFGIPMYEKEGFEADDVLGTVCEMMKQNKEVEIVIASGDMDTMQLIEGKKVQVYTLKKGINDTIMYDEQAVFDRFGFGPKLIPDYKGLRGDPSDNIIGIAGIGEKTATDLILAFGSIEDMYKKLKKDEEAFVKAGIKPRIVELLKKGEDDALFSKVLATIRLDAPIDFVLPEKEWKDNLDIEKISALFTELEFRGLPSRLREVMHEVFKVETGTLFGGGTEGEGKGEGVGTATAESADPAVESVDPVLLKEIAIASWLLNSNLTNPSLEDIIHFAKTKTFTEARTVIENDITQKNLSNVFETIEKPLIPVVEKMEKIGVRVDVDFLKKLSLEYHGKLDAIETKIFEMAGLQFNVNSPKQLGDILFNKMGLGAGRQKRTAGGALSTKESELEKLKDKHPIIQYILEHRELQKLLGTYIDTIPTQCDSTGRLHANFLQTGTTTGRMSSQNPNLQNIPNHSPLGKEIRKAFVADKGFRLVALDYSQIELRIAAFLSGDEKLLEIFRKGEDVHTSVASHVFGVPAGEVDKEMRRRAKVINFGVMYGMGVLALKQNLGTSREEAQKFYNDYFEKFNGLSAYLNRVKAETNSKGYTETFFGRRRYFDGIRSPLPYIRAMAERMAINAPIQGTEADIIKLAMIQTDAFLKKEGLEKDVRLILQVHDELVYEIKEDVAEKVTPKIQKIMEGVIDPKDISGVVCKVEASVGTNWGEMEKAK
jgi:DNA polymerase-1